MWNEIKTAPANETVLVCNPNEGRVPVVAKRVGSEWLNIGAVPVGYRGDQTPRLYPTPTHWMHWPEMPTS